MSILFTRDDRAFHFEIIESLDTFGKSHYNESTLRLQGNLEGDEAFFVLLAGLVAVESASLTVPSRNACTFRVSRQLGSSHHYTFDHFTEEIADLVTQLEERAEWRRTSQKPYLVQAKRGKPREVYITASPELFDRSHDIVEALLRNMTLSAPGRPARVGSDGTYLVALPLHTTVAELKQSLHKYSL